MSRAVSNRFYVRSLCLSAGRRLNSGASRVRYGADKDHASNDKSPDHVSRFRRGIKREVSHDGGPRRDQQPATWRRRLPRYQAQQSPNRGLGNDRVGTLGSHPDVLDHAEARGNLGLRTASHETVLKKDRPTVAPGKMVDQLDAPPRKGGDDS